MIESEKGIIGCILLDSDCLNEIYRDLPIEAFANEFNRDCYETMLAMYDTGAPIDLISLASRLGMNIETSRRFCRALTNVCKRQHHR